MPRVCILSSEAVSRLRAELVTPERIEAYRTAASCSFLRPEDLKAAPVEVPEVPPLLEMSGPPADAPSTDAVNAEAVFQYMPSLKPVYAADARLWAALTHGPFWKYTRWRYPKIPIKEPGDYLRSHWFVVGAGLASLRRNAVARLWWAAYLTVAPWDADSELDQFRKADRFYYTRVMLSSQQVYQDVMERDFGSNSRLRICFLDAFEQHRAHVTAPDKLMKLAVMKLNLLLEYRHLLTLAVPAMHAECMTVVSQSVAALDTDHGADELEANEEAAAD